MCWNSSKKPVKQVAKEDITCYKYTEASKLGTKRKYLWGLLGPKMPVIRSYVQDYMYRFNQKNPKVKLVVKTSKTLDGSIYYKIDKGYHSYTTKPCVYNENLLALECTIPKGAVYYENEFYEFVSEQIIINKTL